MTNTKPTQCKWRIRRHYIKAYMSWLDWAGAAYPNKKYVQGIANKLNADERLQHIHHTVERVEESEDAE